MIVCVVGIIGFGVGGIGIVVGVIAGIRVIVVVIVETVVVVSVGVIQRGGVMWRTMHVAFVRVLEPLDCVGNRCIWGCLRG